MSTSTIDFSKYEQQSAPAHVDFSKYEGSTEQRSTGSHVVENFASGLGIGSDEEAKNFFRHPINTLMNSFEAQGQLAREIRLCYP